MKILYALITLIGLSQLANAGIQNYLYVHNNTGKIIEVQVNGRWKGVIDPGATGQYYIGHSASSVDELYAEDASTGYYWSKSVSTAESSYNWYVP